MALYLAGAGRVEATAASAATPASPAQGENAKPKDFVYRGKKDMHGGVLPQRWALVIGIDHYQPVYEDMDLVGKEKIPDLSNSLSDADLIASRLEREVGFITRVIKPTETHPFLLRSDIINALTKFVTDVSNAYDGRPPILLLYYAGHGVNHHGVDYFASADFKPRYDSDVAMMGLSIKQIQDRLALAHPSLQIIIADACRTDFEIPLLVPSSERADAAKMRAGLVVEDDNSVHLIGDNDRVVVFSTLVGNPAAGGSMKSKEGKFAKSFVGAVDDAVGKAGDPNAGGRPEFSTLIGILHNAKSRMASGGTEIQRIQIDEDAADLSLFPSEADYKEEQVSFRQLNDRMIKYVTPATDNESNRDEVDQRAQYNSYRYCQYYLWVTRKHYSPYSYFGAAAFNQIRELAIDLLNYGISQDQLTQLCDNNNDVNTFSNAPGATKPSNPRTGFLSPKGTATAVFRGLTLFSSVFGRGDENRAAVLVADNSRMIPIGLPSTKAVFFRVSDALKDPSLDDDARSELAKFATDTPIDTIAAASIDTNVYPSRDLRDNGPVGKLRQFDLVHILDLGVDAGDDASAKIETSSSPGNGARITGYVRREVIEPGRIAISFAVTLGAEKGAAIGDDKTGDFHYNKAVVDTLLASSLVIDAAADFGDARDSSGFSRASRVVDYFSGKWEDPDGIVPRVLPRIGLRRNSSALDARYRDPDIIRVTLSLLPLSEPLRRSMVSFKGAISGTSIATELALDVSNVEDIFDTGASGASCAKPGVATSGNISIRVHHGQNLYEYEDAKKIGSTLRRMGYGVLDEGEDFSELPRVDEIRFCQSEDLQSALHVRWLLRDCGLGSFNIRKADTNHRCEPALRDMALDVSLGNYRGTINIDVKESFDEEQYVKQANILKQVLAASKYKVSGPEFVNFNIGRNEIRYCDPINLIEAETLKHYLESVRYNPFTVKAIDDCDPTQRRNTLEVWLNGVEP